MLRRNGVGPLVVRTGSSSPSNEQARTPRAARCKTMRRHEFAKSLITRDQTSPRMLSIARDSAFARVSSTTTEMTGKQEQKGMYPNLAFERVSSVQSQSNFEELRVSSVKSRLKRSSSITTCVTDLLRAQSPIHRTPSMEMLEDFQKLEVQTDTTDNKSSMYHRTSSRTSRVKSPNNQNDHVLSRYGNLGPQVRY